MRSAALLILALAIAAAQQHAPAPASLDFTYFKEKVQPIFLKKRPGHARCVTCHAHGSPPLQPIAAGAANWNDTQSRKNFDIWKQFVTPGQPLKSPLLLHPLAESAGGDRFHAGGKHWKSQSDPEWQTLADWVLGHIGGGSK
ncbi:MAG TPA: hypothetical protein VGF59_07530 [Bryobacteraceae bacterium]|jgi:hypothetical protein